MRKYLKKIESYADIMTIEEWWNCIDNSFIMPDDGHGYWCKDGKESDSKVFLTVPKDATHVAWYNK